MQLISSEKLIRLLSFILLLVFYAVSANARDYPWIKVQTPKFIVLSQQSEKKTKKWAEKFDKYITALHILYKKDDQNLRPLTILLFKNTKAFSPYRLRSESGEVKKIMGLFINRDNGSIIGLPSLNSSDYTRRVLFHEAVHWYIDSYRYKPPLWLEEGFAECFSTFEIKKDKGIWGIPIQEHIEYLNIKGLQPTEDFLRTFKYNSLNEGTYYPQAWTMVHYIMFGDGGKHRGSFGVFLSEIKSTTTKKAFEKAFGMTYSEFDKKLAGYIRGGSYNLGQIDLNEIKTEMKVEPVSDMIVDISLGRLAIGAGLFDKGVEHAEKVIAGIPSRPEGYELLAMASVDPEERDRKKQALKKAIDLNSKDPQVYLMQASMLLTENLKDNIRPDEILEKDIAGKIADQFRNAILLGATDKYAFEGYIRTLLNMNKYKADDRKMLELARSYFPENGTVRVGLALLDKMDGNINSFNKMIAEAFDESMSLPIDLKKFVEYKQKVVYHEWLNDQLEPFFFKKDYEKVETLLNEQKAISYTSTLGEVFDEFDNRLSFGKMISKAETLLNDLKLDEAEAIIKNIQSDKRYSRGSKTLLTFILNRIKNKRAYVEAMKE